MVEREVFIVKADGARERFDGGKLLSSLSMAGAEQGVSEEIVRHVEKELVEGMSTADIYRHAFERLHRTQKSVAARYSLKRALVELGPSGFAFEKYVADLFKEKGFQTVLDVTIRGHCAEHEIDVVAWNDAKLILVEAKFHNELGLKSDLKVALYVKARFEDLAGETLAYGRSRRMDEGQLVTNTKFTDKAIAYSACAGVKLIGWNYPAKGNLHDMIEETGLHPVTCISDLSGRERELLVGAGIILCRDLRERQNALSSLGFSADRIRQLMEETALYCGVSRR